MTTRLHFPECNTAWFLRQNQYSPTTVTKPKLYSCFVCLSVFPIDLLSLQTVLLPTMLPKSRLGKRSPLGALVCTSCPSMESTLETGAHGDPEGGVGSPTMGPPGPQHLSRFNNKLLPGQKVRETFLCYMSCLREHQSVCHSLFQIQIVLMNSLSFLEVSLSVFLYLSLLLSPYLCTNPDLFFLTCHCTSLSLSIVVHLCHTLSCSFSLSLNSKGLSWHGKYVYITKASKINKSERII